MCNYVTFSLTYYNCVVRKLHRVTKSKLTIYIIEGTNMINELKARARRIIRESFIITPQQEVITELSNDAVTEMCTSGVSIDDACTIIYDKFKEFGQAAQVKSSSVKRSLELLNRHARHQQLEQRTQNFLGAV